MQSDAGPDSEPFTETEWVEAEQIRALMATARGSLMMAALVVPVMLAVLADSVPTGHLTLWALAAVGVFAYRYRFMAGYARDMAQAGTAQQIAFMKRYGFTWPLSAALWGASAWLFFDKTPVEDQFVSWLVLVGLSTFSINNFSIHLRTMTSYVNALALTALGVMLWRVGVDLQFHGPASHYALMALVVIYWQLLLQVGRRLHVTHRHNMELKFHNNHLIASLTQQTQAALRAVEIKNRFLASAAHDIRQPVHALGLYADWLASEPELVKEIAPKIVESTKAVNALFDSLFDLARLDSGKVNIKIEPVCLARLMRELELHYRPLAEAKGLEFRMRVTDAEVMSDPIFLQRILGNVISNSVKYTTHGGILLASRVTPRGARVEIHDTGLGIAPQHQQDVFQDFFKVPVHSGTDDGFGLGLAIVSRLSDILGHPLRMASRPGRGTSFRLELKASDAEAANQRASALVAQIVSRP